MMKSNHQKKKMMIQIKMLKIKNKNKLNHYKK